MKKLHSYVLKTYVGPLVLTFFISMFILLMQFLWKYIDDLVGKGLETSVIVELLSYATIGLVPMALPLAILLASLMTFGNMGEDYELTAMKAAGIPLLRIMIPLIAVILIISFGAFLFSNYVLPYTNLKTGSLLWDIKHQRPELDIKEGVFNNDLEDYTIRVGKKSKKDKMMYNFMLYDHTSRRGNSNVIVSDSAKMYTTKDKKYLVLHLYSGSGYEEISENRRYNIGNNHPIQKYTFDQQRFIFDLSGFKLTRTDDQLFKHNYQMKNIKELTIARDSLDKEYLERQKSFTRVVMNGHTFTHEKKISVPDSVIINYDSIYTSLKTDTIISLDSIYNTFDSRKKQMVLSQALSQAHNAKDYISTSKDDFTGRLRWLKRHEIEWHRKFTLAFACFIFFFIGAPLGAIIRKGGLGMPTVTSVLFFLVYYVISLSGEKFAREAIIPSFQGMWIASLVLLPLGVFLTYKATNDSQLLNLETYVKFVNRVVKIFTDNNNNVR